jgi:hypothetical protein
MITLVVVFRLLTVLRELLTVIAKDIRLVSIASTLTSVRPVLTWIGFGGIWLKPCIALASADNGCAIFVIYLAGGIVAASNPLVCQVKTWSAPSEVGRRWWRWRRRFLPEGVVLQDLHSDYVVPGC